MSQLDHLFPRSLQRSLFDRIDSDKVLWCTAAVRVSMVLHGTRHKALDYDAVFSLLLLILQYSMRCFRWSDGVFSV